MKRIKEIIARCSVSIFIQNRERIKRNEEVEKKEEANRQTYKNKGESHVPVTVHVSLLLYISGGYLLSHLHST
ncbi:hypothetical protein, partial [Porphyromonas sp. COT-108 OH1349]|uniref:hypothetical protein n=1 Tax=Porphyromonas sp. COT-108 OH1349 TaxID=1537504 RepID=UPI001F41C948